MKVGLLVGVVLVTACGARGAGGTQDAGGADAATMGPDARGGTGGDAGTVGWWQPTPGTSWQLQLSGTVDTTVDVAVYDVDMADTPQATIDTLHAAGRKVVCYFSAGSREDWRADASAFPAAVQGKGLVGWPGEVWLDVRASAVRDVMKARFDVAVQKHCDGVDPDNVDGFANDTGFPLTAADQVDYNRFLANEGHARGLAVGLKNDVGQVADLVGNFDWQLNEQCFMYAECDTVMPFVNGGKPVWNVEYGDATLATTVCPLANARNFDTLVKQLALGPERIACR